ncbi:MAG: hypothetical protein QM401_09520 [Bacillota bacterium]|nr:hypothetical protein [Bacillota bacterium]HHU62257.1 hypothetical protein [Natronincola sp.]
MSIKFPDFQVLVTRADQVPRPNREGDQTGAAGKMAPQVSKEFVSREQKVDHSKGKDKVRERDDEQDRRQKQDEDSQEDKQKKQRPGGRRRIDLRA